MKKTFLFSLFLITSIIGHAQIEVGVMLAPNISFNRVFDNSDDLSFDRWGSIAPRFSAGPMVDIFIKNNIALTTGIWYTSKRTGFEAEFEDGDNGGSFSTRMNLQYIQIPVGVKFYTNEIMNTLQAYLQLGGTLDTKIAEKIARGDEVSGFGRLFDAGLNLHGGVEFNINSSNKVFVGLMYNRGLVNVASRSIDVKHENPEWQQRINNDNLRINNDYISIVGGFKF